MKYASTISFLILAGFSLLFVEMAIPHPGLHHNIEQVTDLLAEDPNRADLLIKRSYYYRLSGKLVESLNDLHRAKELDKNNLEITLQCGITMAAMGRDKEAETELDNFLNTGKATSLAFSTRGQIRARTGRPELAIGDFTSAIRMKPKIELYLTRGQLQESLGKLDEAAAGYRDGLSHLGGGILLKMSLIRVETARKNYDMALILINEELARASVKTMWYLRKAEILTASGLTEKAHLARKQALAEANRILKKRTIGVHLVSRAKVYIAMDQLEAAKHDLRLAVSKSPRFAAAHELLANLETGMQKN